jgi:hypothetical protein
MKIKKDIELQTHVSSILKKKTTNIYLLTPLIHSIHHNPLSLFISSICPPLHHHILDTTIVTKSSATNHKLEKETQLCLQHS